ncbi:hypothetical protein QR680_004638 [Steinernema hermaphroditum]|uniref:C-type lectin domain-containing protein n=1 Tax=Steinernema hermaphroditum TaxID=289476 RepID=A0AA39HRM0_9BILA|nr:hypothetical protein QR680_004638 [Steinernema hermaphroditum]
MSSTEILTTTVEPESSTSTTTALPSVPSTSTTTSTTSTTTIASTSTTTATTTSPIEDQCQNMANCHQNNVYHVVTKAMNWTTAENECLTMNGKLSSILNEEESVFVGQLLFQHPVIARFDFTVWIGGYRSPRGSRPRFRWVDYQPFSYENFYKNQPNEVPENDCLEIFDPTYRKWANYDCERERPFLCKIPLQQYRK